MITKRFIKSRGVVKLTFEIPFSELPQGLVVENVHLVGDFNDWDHHSIRMKRDTRSKSFKHSLEVNPGQNYEFRYLLNSTHWYNDWNADGYRLGSYGEENCIVSAPDAV